MIGWGRRKKQNCYLTRVTSEKAKWVSVFTRRQEPGLKGTVFMSVELSISAVQLCDSNRCTEHSNPQPLFTRGKKSLQTRAKNHIPGGQNNLISSLLPMKNGELMCLPEEMTQNPRQQQLSDHQKDKWVLVDHSGTPWRDLYSYFSLSPTNFTPAKGF